MKTQAHTEVPLTRRQIAARERAARTKAVNAAAKAWLASRKDSQTPAADRLIARHIGKGWNEASAREILHSCLRSESENYIGRFETSYCFAQGVAYQLMRYGLISQRNNLTNVVAFMQEAGVPAYYWEREAAQLAAQQEAKPRARRKPVQLPLIQADELATADSNVTVDVTVTPVGAETETTPDDPPPSAPVVATVESRLDEVQRAYNAAWSAHRAILRQRNRRLRAIKGFLSPQARQAKAAVMAEYAEPLAEYGVELKRTTGLLVRMGHPPYPYATDGLAERAAAPQTAEGKAETVTLPARQSGLQVTTNKRTDKARKQDSINFLQSDAIKPQPFIRHSQVPHTDKKQQQQAKTGQIYCSNNGLMNGSFKPFTPLLIKFALFFMRLPVSTQWGLFWNYPINQIIGHANLTILLRQCLVIVSNIRGQQHVVTKIFEPPKIVVPLLVPRGSRLVSNAAQLNTIQMPVSCPHFIKYLCSQWMSNSGDKPFSLSTHDCLLLGNGIASVVFKVVIGRGNDWAIRPCFHLLTNQRLVIQPQRPTMGNVDQLNQLHWRDRPTFRLGLANKVVGNSQRWLRLHGAIPAINDTWQRGHCAIPTVNSSTALAA